jgi:hypothetical protein
MRSYSILEMLTAVRRMPSTMPQSERFYKSGYDTHKDHWVGWLGAYNGPGYYSRSNWERDARYVYQHLNCGPMIVWLNEAAGERQTTIRAAIAAMLRAGPRAQTEAKVVRSFLPWERAALLLFGLPSYSVSELLRAVRRLPATMPESDRLSKGGYATHKDHWIRWLEEYDGPGYYGRSDWNVDACAVYQRLNNGHMIVWLNEAAGENLAVIRGTIRAMELQGPSSKQSKAKIARAHHPWERAASLLFK